MKYAKSVLIGFGALGVLVTPAWAHPSSGAHVHGETLVLLLIFVAALGALMTGRRRRASR